jgi:2-polyprenyl-6-hydroxyphenyl methylase/3-demethylubiquinone-9 3-methyltransferase
MSKSQINNEFYDELGSQWYDRNDHPVALLRAENRLRIPWIKSEIEAFFSKSCNILDIGCGAGFLSNSLSRDKHQVTGIDTSESSLQVAAERDITKSVKYIQAEAEKIPFSDRSFDVVCAMDLLEHVFDVRKVIFEASRVLKKAGLFFFHTFNKNPLSYLTIIKGVDWFVPGAPKNMHVYSLFIRPKTLKRYCQNASLEVEYLMGFSPVFLSKDFFTLITRRRIHDRFPFKFTKSTLIGYSGIAKKMD